MDKLTLVMITAQQPRRGIVYSGVYSNHKTILECAQCALAWLDAQRERGVVMDNDVLGNSVLAMPGHVSAVGPRCHTCEAMVEF